MTDIAERVKTYKQLIGGEFVDAADGRTAEVINPANDQVIANVPASSNEDVDRAVDAADTAFQSWKKTTPQDRSLLLLKIADALEARGDELGRLESANAGKPVGAAIDEIGRLRRPVPVLRGCEPRDGRPRRQRVRGRAHLDHPARPDRRRRLDRALELPAVHGVVEARPGARDREHGRAQALGADPADAPSRSPRSSTRSCPRASSTSSRAPAARSATRSSGTRRCAWSRSPATRRRASASRASRRRA